MRNKKTKHLQQKQKVREDRSTRLALSKPGLVVITLGAGVTALGYGVLSLVDPAGQNWASLLSPFLILGGYVLMGIGILVPGKSAESSATHQP